MSNVYTTKVSRDHSGKLSAETIIPLGSDRRELRIYTYKGNRGLTCNASVFQVSEDGRSFNHAIGFGLCGDFSTTLGVDANARGTEKAICALHAKCLAEKGEVILASARDWYASGRNIRS
jgi:hypothetical protein